MEISFTCSGALWFAAGCLLGQYAALPLLGKIWYAFMQKPNVWHLHFIWACFCVGSMLLAIRTMLSPGNPPMSVLFDALRASIDIAMTAWSIGRMLEINSAQAAQKGGV